MAVFNDANLEKAYQSIYGQLQGSGGYTPLSMPEQTLDSITEQLSNVLRPQYERAIAQRYGATKQQKASIDVDAASRGMGSSTWVTDAKNRIMNAEAADIAGMESDYASQLAGDALNQYNNYLGDKLALDKYNQGLLQALGDDAYNRAMQQLSAGLISPVSKGGRGGGNPSGGDNPLDEIGDIGINDEYLKALRAENDELRGMLEGNKQFEVRPIIPTGVQPKTTAGGGISNTKAFSNHNLGSPTQAQLRR